MNIQELNRLLSHPAEVNSSHFPSLRELLAAYPYVSSFHLLYQRGLANEGDVISDAELQHTALYVPNRNQLMSLLMPKADVAPAGKVVEEQAPVAPSVSLSQLAPSIKAETEQPETEVAASNSMVFADEVNAFLSHYQESLNNRKAQSAEADAPVRARRVEESSVDGDNESQESAEPDNVDSAPHHNEFFTETLAKIYIKQEKFQKAIDIFEKLCTKYPEKRDYYEQQIRFLKKLVMYL